MANKTPFQPRKLERQARTEAVSGLQRRIQIARMRTKNAIEEASRKAKIATSKKERDKLEARINGIYATLNKEFDTWLSDMLREMGPVWDGQTRAEINGTSEIDLVKFSRARVRRYAELIHQANDGQLAAVLTRQMSQRAIRDLRFSVVDTFRQATIEGWTANQTQKQLQNAWDKVSGNTEGRRFIDRGGKEWKNSRYLQMLVRTTMQRASRDIQIDTLTDEGFELGRISHDSGDPCPICEAWEGAIIRLAGTGEGGGRFPTYRQSLDAGMWHPNCTHRVEYIDEDLEADEIEIQSEEPSPGDWGNPDRVLEYRNGIDQKRYIRQGLSAAEAKRAVIRDRMSNRLRAGGFTDRFGDEIKAIPDTVLDQMDLQKLPHFRYLKTDEGDESFSRNSSRGGWIVLDRTDGSAAFKRGFYSLQTKRGVEIAKKVVPKISLPKKTPSSGLAAYQQAVKNAGFSPELVEHIGTIPDAVLKKMPNLPTLLDSKRERHKAFYKPSDHAVYMETSTKAWAGNPTVFDHELGHALHTKTKALVGNVIDDGLRSAIEADYKSWKKAAKEAKGEKWREYFSRSGIMHRHDLARALGAESYGKATDEQKHRVLGFLDSIGGLSKGKYGEGHSVSYYKTDKGVGGYAEVYANGYRAIVNKWDEYDKLMPLTTKWIRNSIGL